MTFYSMEQVAKAYIRRGWNHDGSITDLIEKRLNRDALNMVLMVYIASRIDSIERAVGEDTKESRYADRLDEWERHAVRAIRDAIRDTAKPRGFPSHANIAWAIFWANRIAPEKGGTIRLDLPADRLLGYQRIGSMSTATKIADWLSSNFGEEHTIPVAPIGGINGD